jgi:hypothetical protein
MPAWRDCPLSKTCGEGGAARVKERLGYRPTAKRASISIRLECANFNFRKMFHDERQANPIEVTVTAHRAIAMELPIIGEEVSPDVISDNTRCPRGARLLFKSDKHRRFLDRLALRHDRVRRKRFIRPAQRDAFHDDLIVGYSRVLAHHG